MCGRTKTTMNMPSPTRGDRRWSGKLLLVRAMFVSSCVAVLVSTFQVTIQQQASPTVAVRSLYEFDAPTSVDDVPPPPQQSWIHVHVYEEGISKWRVAIPELLGLAKILNATLVEPCVIKGRAKTCELLEMNSTKIRLSDIFEVGHFMDMTEENRAFPLMVTHETYEQQIGALNKTKFFPVCIRFGSPPLACGQELTEYFQDEDIPAITNFHHEAANREHDKQYPTLVLDIQNYRSEGLNSFQLGGQKVVYEAPLETFHRKHVDAVNKLLQKGSVIDDNFVLVHWRAERTDIDYEECATAIIDAGKLMQTTHSTNTSLVLMSSLNERQDLMWRGNRQLKLAAAAATSPQKALKRLSDGGFLKLDEFLEENDGPLVDVGILAVWDLILAQKAKDFATCTNQCMNEICAKCNFLGRFSETAIAFRDVDHKPSRTCWPTTLTTTPPLKIDKKKKRRKKKH